MPLAADETLIASLRRRVLDEVRRVTKRGPIALLDFPNYANPGDSAIWLGALECFASLGLPAPAYTSDHRTFDERMLRRVMPTGTIFLTGGGNLGDLWPGAQTLRERVLRAFPDHAIVQLPQTVHFGDPAALARARDAFAAHPNCTILVRDQKSLAVATKDLGCRASLCPDLAFCLLPSDPALGTRRRHSSDLLHLLRTDHESAGAFGSVQAVDWVTDVASPLNKLSHRLSDVLVANAAPSMLSRAARTAVSASYATLARQRLRRGTRLLSSARVVVTDRLHGHVLALLVGVPHVVLGDRNGKLRGFFDAWTSSASITRWATTPDEVPALVSELRGK